MKTAIYSGSFNPVHKGHTQLAQYLLDHHLAEEVWMVVSPCNPLKEQADLLDEYLRLDMLMLAIKDYPAFKASDIEFTMPIPSYSIDTLTKLSEEFPDREFCLVIGSDNALVFDKWKNYRELLERYEILVYPRWGYNFEEVAGLYPQMKYLNTPYYDISSTTIRTALAQNKDMSEWLHPDVISFIRENQLYQNSDDLSGL